MIALQELQLFVAVADTGLVGQAGERVGYKTRAASSLALQRLENQVGARLVDRDRGRSKAGLTEAGDAFLPYARRAVNAYHNGLLRLWQYDQEGKVDLSR